MGKIMRHMLGVGAHMVKGGISAKTIAGIWMAAAAATFGMLLVAVYVSSVQAPIADEWRYVDPTVYLRELLLRNNGHPFVIGRLGMALDYYLFDASGWALRATSIVFCWLNILSVLWIARLCGYRSFVALAVLGSFATIALFAASGVQNFNYGMQFTFMLAWTSTTAAIAAFAAYADEARTWKLLAAGALCVIAMLSLGNGFLAGFIVAAMSWRLGMPHRVTLGLLGLAIVCTLARVAMPDVSVPIPRSDIPSIIIYTVRVLGGVPAAIFAELPLIGASAFEPLQIALVFGLLELALAAPLFYLAVFRQPLNPGRVGAVGVATFAFISAAAMALSRAFMGEQFALASRYAIVSATFLIGVALLAWQVIEGFRYKTLVLAAGAAAAAFAPIAAIGEIHRLTQMQREFLLPQTALVVGLPQPGYLAGLLPAEEVVAQNASLRAHGKWLFRDQWTRRVGQQVDVPEAMTTCNGDIALSAPVDGAPAFAWANGHVDADAARNGRIIVITDSSGTMTGYGLVPSAAGDLWPFSAHTGERAWMGTVRIPAPNSAPAIAYLASPESLLCRIGSAPS